MYIVYRLHVKQQYKKHSPTRGAYSVPVNTRILWTISSERESKILKTWGHRVCNAQ